MIAELFYPNELKKIIRDLEAEGNLRREPLDMLNKFINIMFVFAVIIALLSFQDGGVILSLIFLLLFIVINIIVVRSQFKYFEAFIYGQKQKVVVRKIKTKEFLRTIPNSNIYCERLSDGKKIIIPRISNNAIKGSGISIGKKIVIYDTDHHAVHAIPNMDIFIKQFCLRKDFITGESNA